MASIGTENGEQDVPTMHAHAASALHSLASSSNSQSITVIPPSTQPMIVLPPHLNAGQNTTMPSGVAIPQDEVANAEQPSATDISLGPQSSWMYTFWQNAINVPTDTIKPFKDQILPLARVRKIMRLADDEIQMIATETPLLLAKATEAFIADLTVRAFASEIETGMRRTLQKADIAKATGKTDMFDFLIDILPRETKPTVATTISNRTGQVPTSSSGGNDSVVNSAPTEEDRQNAQALALFQASVPSAVLTDDVNSTHHQAITQ